MHQIFHPALPITQRYFIPGNIVYLHCNLLPEPTKYTFLIPARHSSHHSSHITATTECLLSPLISRNVFLCLTDGLTVRRI